MQVVILLSVLMICMTILCSVDIIFKRGFTITHIHKDITDKEEISKDISKDNKEDKDNTLDTEQIATVSMDEVIKAANMLMGVETLEEDNNAK